MPVVSVGQLTITDVNDGLNLVLTNVSHNVPTDSAGNSPVFTGAVSTARVLAGGTDVTSEWKIIAVSSVGLTGTFTNNTYTVTAMTTDVGTVDFTATKIGSSDLTARFTVTKSKKGDTGTPGLNGITIVLSNEAHTLPANSSGAVSSYANSGTTIRVFEGNTELNAVSGATSNGSFGIGTPTQLPASTITVGAITYSSKTASVANHSAMVNSTDSVVISYPITIKRSNGATITVTKTQTITKSKQGSTGGTGPTGPRGTVHLFKQISGDVWSDSEASNLFITGQPYSPVIIADRVTLFNNARSFSQTRAWTGTAWEIQSEVIDGNLLVTKSITADKININDLFAQRITLPDGGVIRAGTTTYAEMGGDGYFTAQGESGPIFKIGKDNDHFINGEHIIQTLPWQAFDGSVIPYIREQLALGTPSAGGSAAGSGTLTSAGVTVTTTGSIPSAGASSAITVATSYGGYSIRLNGGEVGPQIPQVSVQLYRIVNDGTPVAIGSLTTKSGNVLPAEPLGSGVYQWTVRVPGFNVSMSDASPGVGNIKYRAIVTIANPPTNQLGTVSLSANQPATGVVSGTVNWSSILNKPNLSLVGHVHSAADITSGTLATARGGTGRTDGKVTALATARTLTLGNTGKNFDGSANVSWTLAEMGAQAALGFTPIQQAGGAGQSSNKIYIGWSGTDKLRLQVDNTDFGSTWPMAVTGTAGSINGFNNPTTGATPNTIAYRDPSADVSARLFRSNYPAESYFPAGSALAFRSDSASDNYIRFCSDPALIRSWVGANNASNLTQGTISDALLPATFSQKLISKAVNAIGGLDYHLELYSPNSGSTGGEIAVRFHQGGQWYHSIRANANGFRFTTGSSNNLERLTAGAYYFGDNGGYMGAGADGSMRVQSPTGYIDVGSQNAALAHFYTDRPQFYFNKPTQVQGYLELYGTSWYFGNGSMRNNLVYARHVDGTDGAAGVGSLYLQYNTPGYPVVVSTHLIANSPLNEVLARNVGSYDHRARGILAPWHYGPDVSFEFQASVSHGIGGGSYTGSMIFRPYGSGSDWSGGSAHKLLFSDTGSLFHQIGNGGGWGAVKEIAKYEPSGYLYTKAWVNIPDNNGLFWNSGTHLRSVGNGKLRLYGGENETWMMFASNGDTPRGYVYADYTNQIGFLNQNGGWSLRVDAGSNVYANDFIATSDRRIKSELEVIPNALDKVSKMTGYTYMKKGNDIRRQAGYIAQDLQAVLPEGVFEYDDVLQVSHSATIGLLLNAVNELSAEVKELKRRLH